MKIDRRTQYSKMVIKNSLLELLEFIPLNKISVKELCLKADINRATFYRYYSDIYDLYKQLEMELIPAETLSADRSNEADTIKDFTELVSLIYDNQKFYYTLFNTLSESEYIESIIMESYSNLLQKSKQENPNIDLTYFEYSFEAIKCGIIGILKKWVHGGCIDSKAKIIIISINFFSNINLVTKK